MSTRTYTYQLWEADASGELTQRLFADEDLSYAAESPGAVRNFVAKWIRANCGKRDVRIAVFDGASRVL